MQDKALVTDSHHQNIEKKDAISEISLIYLDIFFFIMFWSVTESTWQDLWEHCGGKLTTRFEKLMWLF